LAKHTVTKLHGLSRLSEYSATDVSNTSDPTLKTSRVKPGDSGNRASCALSRFMEQFHRSFRLRTGRRMPPLRQLAAQAETNLVRFWPVSEYVYDRGERAGVLVLREYDISRQCLALPRPDILAQFNASGHAD
jgi:hypothetical protein